jgi:hypothetical protein
MGAISRDVTPPVVEQSTEEVRDRIVTYLEFMDASNFVCPPEMGTYHAGYTKALRQVVYMLEGQISLKPIPPEFWDKEEIPEEEISRIEGAYDWHKGDPVDKPLSIGD